MFSNNYFKINEFMFELKSPQSAYFVILYFFHFLKLKKAARCLKQHKIAKNLPYQLYALLYILPKVAKSTKGRLEVINCYSEC